MFVNMSLGTVLPGVSISVTELFETVGFVFVPCLVNSAFSMSSMEFHGVVWPLPLLGKPSLSFDRPALCRKSGGKFWLDRNSEATGSTNAASLTPFTSNPDHCARRTIYSLTHFSYLCLFTSKLDYQQTLALITVFPGCCVGNKMWYIF